MSRLLRALGVLAALTLAGSLLGAGTAVARGTDPDPAQPTQAVGECYALTKAQAGASSVTAAAIACSQRHTSQVTAVGTLPAALTWDSPVAKIGAAVRATCGPALDELVGANPLLRMRSQYTWIWFQPTEAQSAAGARWFSCHAIAMEDSRLGALPSPLPKVTKRMADAVATCATRKHAWTTCSDTHAWRMGFTFYATGRMTKKNVDRAAVRTCPRHVTSRTWMLTAVDVPGKRFMVGCISKTRH